MLYSMLHLQPSPASAHYRPLQSRKSFASAAAASTDAEASASKSQGEPRAFHPTSTFLHVEGTVNEVRGLSKAFLLGGGFKKVVRLLEKAGYRRCLGLGERGTTSDVIRELLTDESGLDNNSLGRVLRLLGVSSLRVADHLLYGVTRAPASLAGGGSGHSRVARPFPADAAIAPPSASSRDRYDSNVDASDSKKPKAMPRTTVEEWRMVHAEVGIVG